MPSAFERTCGWIMWIALYSIFLWITPAPHKVAVHIAAAVDLVMYLRYGDQTPPADDFVRYIAVGMLLISIGNK